MDYVVKQITSNLTKIVSKKLKGINVKPSMIKENFIFFIDSTINKPEFSSQSKDQLKTPVKDFGSKYKLTETFMKAIVKTGVVDYIVSKAEILANAGMGKTDGKKTAILNMEKLCDAGQAGKKESEQCCMFFTEGDSAKTMAMTGFNIIGRKHYGVFPLRGKLKNVSKETTAANMKKLNENEEIIAIKKILGLKNGKVYENLKDLRYGKVCILTDQDVDGYHIKGLIMNFIHYYWPSLIKYKGFITSFPTPYVKASKGSGSKRVVNEFYSIPEFEEWKSNNADGKGWTIKPYKGLGTSTPKESQEYFKNFKKNLKTYYCPPPSEHEHKKNKTDTDSEITEEDEPYIDYEPKFKDPTKESFSLAFDGGRENNRKSWMNNYDPNKYLDNTAKKISYTDFINTELRAFAIYNVSRAVPNIMDGFKPSQRKIYYASVMKNIYTKEKEIRVAQLGGYISEKASYHHGEASLYGAIVKMAQNYVGSNNLNLLYPQGAFGTRLEGGGDAASPRYIHTFLEDLGKKIFIENDYPVLNHQKDDGRDIEPEFYVPIIPMILANGVIGIGTGFSSTIEPCDPRDIVDNIRRILDGSKCKKMTPWYRHFTGQIEKIDSRNFLIRAQYEIIGTDTLHITDLPIRTWTENYKTFLMKLLNGKAVKNATTAKKPTKKVRAGSKAKGKKDSAKSRTATVAKTNTIGQCIKSYTEKCTDIKVDITITFHPGKLQQLLKTSKSKKGLGLAEKGVEITKLEEGLKLITTISLSNMHLFNEHGKIVKYDSYGEILKKYAEIRLELYQKRKDYLLGKWRKEMDLLAWKIKFIEYVIDGEIVVFRDGKTKSKAQVIAKLEELEFPKFAENDTSKPNYYYTKIGLYNLTTEEVEKLKDELKDKKSDIKTLKGKSPSDLWTEELDEFMEAYDEWESVTDAEYEELLQGNNPKKSNKKSRKKMKEIEI